jgi:hypothetical protein
MQICVLNVWFSHLHVPMILDPHVVCGRRGVLAGICLLYLIAYVLTPAVPSKPASPFLWQLLGALTTMTLITSFLCVVVTARQVYFVIFLLSLIVGFCITIFVSWRNFRILTDALAGTVTSDRASTMMQPFRRFLNILTVFGCVIVVCLVIAARGHLSDADAVISNSTLALLAAPFVGDFNLVDDFLDTAQPTLILVGTWFAWLRPVGARRDSEADRIYEANDGEDHLETADRESVENYQPLSD